MRILFLRHAEAVEPEACAGGDMQRPLTAKGRRDALAVGRYLAALGIEPDVLLCSPALRAVQTAAHAFGKNHVEVEPRLAPGCPTAHFRALVREHAGASCLLFVGHEPDFSTAIAALIGGRTAVIKMGKGACACLKGESSGAFALRWLIGPQQLPTVGTRK